MDTDLKRVSKKLDVYERARRAMDYAHQASQGGTQPQHHAGRAYDEARQAMSEIEDGRKGIKKLPHREV